MYILYYFIGGNSSPNLLRVSCTCAGEYKKEGSIDPNSKKRKSSTRKCDCKYALHCQIKDDMVFVTIPAGHVGFHNHELILPCDDPRKWKRSPEQNDFIVSLLDSNMSTSEIRYQILLL